MNCLFSYFFFFFQAEDGIRDGHVTGVQTCALPISRSCCTSGPTSSRIAWSAAGASSASGLAEIRAVGRPARSEERRVGKEWGSHRSPCREKAKESPDEREYDRQNRR